jgi:hypothetical protein
LGKTEKRIEAMIGRIELKVAMRAARSGAPGGERKRRASLILRRQCLEFR